MDNAHSQNRLGLALGIWLFITPWLNVDVIPRESAPGIFLNFRIVGIALALFSTLALRKIKIWEELSIFALGLWLICSPWVLSYSDSINLKWNSIVAGIILSSISLAAIKIEFGRHHHSH